MESTTQLINETFVFICLFVTSVVLYAVLSHRADEDGPTNARRLLDRYFVRPDAVLSSEEDAGTETAGTTAIEPVSAPTIPANERDIIIALARIKDDSGKYKYSANEIDAAIKMNRNDVLAIVRAERSSTGGMPDTYQAEPVTPRQTEFARTLPDGAAVRVDRWGNEWVQRENQLIPVDMYITHFLTPQAA